MCMSKLEEMRLQHVNVTKLRSNSKIRQRRLNMDQRSLTVSLYSGKVCQQAVSRSSLCATRGVRSVTMAQILSSTANFSLVRQPTG